MAVVLLPQAVAYATFAQVPPEVGLYTAIGAATGITDGVLLSGVHYHGNEGHTESLVLRCQTGSRRVIRAVHTT